MIDLRHIVLLTPDDALMRIINRAQSTYRLYTKSSDVSNVLNGVGLFYRCENDTQL
jgi:hypothetical protein